MHKKLKFDWVPPPAPAKYPELVVIHWMKRNGGEWHMDFSRDGPEGRFFASDADRCPVIDWPWVDGFEPTAADWRAAGFSVLEVPTDSATMASRSRALIAAFMRGDRTLH